jgi:hypothetical protein
VWLECVFVKWRGSRFFFGALQDVSASAGWPSTTHWPPPPPPPPLLLLLTLLPPSPLLLLQISKNITLAGVGHVTLLDDSPAADLVGSNFLITAAGAEGHT